MRRILLHALYPDTIPPRAGRIQHGPVVRTHHESESRPSPTSIFISISIRLDGREPLLDRSRLVHVVYASVCRVSVCERLKGEVCEEVRAYVDVAEGVRISV